MSENTNKKPTEGNATANEPKKATKSQYLNADAKIQQMKLVFSNAKLPTILPQLQTLGYTEEKLDDYLKKVAELEQLSQNQKREYTEQYAETEKFDAKILFQDDQTLEALGIVVKRLINHDFIE